MLLLLLWMLLLLMVVIIKVPLISMEIIRSHVPATISNEKKRINEIKSRFLCLSFPIQLTSDRMAVNDSLIA